MVSIAVIGGTGNLGKGIARRLAKAGHEVTVGSRQAAKAEVSAAEIGLGVKGAANENAARNKDVVIVTVPYANHRQTLLQIRDKVQNAIVVDATVPLAPPKVTRVQLPAAGSATLEAQQHLGPGVRLVSAFHNVAAHILETDTKVACDVLVFGDDVDARNTVMSLAGDMGLRGLSGGVLSNSAASEALTSVLIYMNKIYGSEGAGIRITGLTSAPPIP